MRQRWMPNKARRTLHIRNKVDPESGTLVEPLTVKTTSFEVTRSLKKSPLLSSGRST
jgi:hypothetical protein